MASTGASLGESAYESWRPGLRLTSSGVSSSRSCRLAYGWYSLYMSPGRGPGTPDRCGGCRGTGAGPRKWSGSWPLSPLRARGGSALRSRPISYSARDGPLRRSAGCRCLAGRSPGLSESPLVVFVGGIVAPAESGAARGRSVHPGPKRALRAGEVPPDGCQTHE